MSDIGGLDLKYIILVLSLWLLVSSLIINSPGCFVLLITSLTYFKKKKRDPGSQDPNNLHVCLDHNSIWSLGLTYRTLWVLGTALAPKVSRITHTELQRRRTKTNAKDNYGIFSTKLSPGIHIILTTTAHCLPVTAWKCSVVFYSTSS